MFNRNDFLIQEEDFEACLEELKDLIPEHYKEIALYQEHIDLNPDFDRYQDLDDNNVLRVYTLRRDAELVGYFICFVQHHIHYKDHKFAMNDVVYIQPQYRKTDLGSELIEFGEKMLAGEGVSVLNVNMKTHLPFDKTMERLGYGFVEMIYGKYIGE